MVDIGIMRVVMVQLFVEMRVRMIPGNIPLMVVPMMFFWVMMQVLMLHRNVVVLMGMPFGRQNQGS